MWLAPLHAQGYPSWGKRELHFFSLSQEIFMPLLCDPLFLLKLLWVVSVIHNQNSSKLPLVRVVGMWKNKMWFVVSFSSLMWTELGIFPKMGKWDILSQCQDCERLVNLPNCLKKEDQKLTRSCRAANYLCGGKSKDRWSASREEVGNRCREKLRWETMIPLSHQWSRCLGSGCFVVSLPVPVGMEPHFLSSCFEIPVSLPQQLPLLV